MKKSIPLFIAFVIHGVISTGIVLYKRCQTIWKAVSNHLPAPTVDEVLEPWQFFLLFFCSFALLIPTYFLSKKEKLIPIKIISLVEIILHLVVVAILAGASVLM